MSSPKLPFPNSYWVVEDKLLAGHYPGDEDEATAQTKLAALLDSGVRHTVNLVEEKRHPMNGSPLAPYREHLMSIAKAAAIDVTYALHPITDQEIPTREMMKSILDDIDRAIGEGQPVYVHCVGGVGRTGTVVGCYLARHGIALGDEVIDRIRELRANDPKADVRSPNTGEQREMVRSWKEGE